MQVRQLTPVAKLTLPRLASPTRITLKTSGIKPSSSYLGQVLRSTSRPVNAQTLRKPKLKTTSSKRFRSESRRTKGRIQLTLEQPDRQVSEVQLLKGKLDREVIENDEKWKLEHTANLVRSLLKHTINFQQIDNSNLATQAANRRSIKPIERAVTRSELSKNQQSHSNSSMHDGSPWLKPRYFPESTVKLLSPKRLSPTHFGF